MPERRRGRALRGASCLTVALALVLALHGQTPEKVLKSGDSVSGKLGGGQIHRYVISLRAGEYLEAVAEQNGVDLAATLFSPEGVSVAYSDLPNADRGPEPVVTIAETTGNYRLELRVTNPATRAGDYELRIQTIRNGTSDDRLRVQAERAIDEGRTLALKRTPAAITAAIAKNRDALAYFKAAADTYRQALTLKQIGTLMAMSGDFRGAVDEFESARTLFHSIGEQSGEASASNNAGGAHDVLGESGKAMERYQQAYVIYGKTGQRAAQANTLSNIGTLFQAMADWQKAIETYLTALPISQAEGDIRRQGQLLHNLGTAYWRTDPARGIEYLEKALALRRSLKDRSGQASTLSELAGTYYTLGQISAAIRAAEEALTIRRDLNDRPGQARILRTLGLAKAKLGQSEDAIHLLDEAVTTAADLHDRRLESLNLRARGVAYTFANKPELALSSFEDARKIAEQIGDRDTLANSLRGKARAERDLSKLTEARRDAEAALDLVEKVRTNAGGEEARASYLSSTLESYELFIDILMLQHEPAAALETSERSRARSLLEMLSESAADIRQGIDPKLLAREHELTNLLNAKGTRLLPLMGRDTPQAAALKKEIRDLETEYQDLEVEIRKSSPRYAALTQPSPLHLKQIQDEVLDPDSVLLEYSLGEKRSYLWAVSKTGIEAWELAPRARIETAARNLLQLIPSHPDGRELSDLILAPAASALDGKRLVIVADGILQEVPFAMLPIPGSREPLLTAHEIVSLPSASALAVLRTELAGRKPASKTLAVFADPVFDTSDAGESRILEHFSDNTLKIPRLPYTAVEADQILRVASGKQNWKATGYNASRAAALSGRLSDYRYIHFATHGVLDTERPSLSALVLSQSDEKHNPQDGFLRVNDIYNTRLSADLVVLSACQTGLGKEVRGEGLMGLTRAFLYAGAPRVIVSLWSVNDRATAELMTMLYRGMLREGKSPAAALRAAQLELRKQKRWESPYYWAAFVQHGEWRER